MNSKNKLYDEINNTQKIVIPRKEKSLKDLQKQSSHVKEHIEKSEQEKKREVIRLENEKKSDQGTLLQDASNQGALFSDTKPSYASEDIRSKNDVKKLRKERVPHQIKQQKRGESRVMDRKIQVLSEVELQRRSALRFSKTAKLRLHTNNKLLISMRNVHKEFQGRSTNTALRGINFGVLRGEFVFIVGESGAGKSTLMKMLYKEVLPSSGDIFIAGLNINKMKSKSVHKLRKTLGIIHQDFKLLPKKTVYENIAFALEVTGEKKRNIHPKVDAVIKEVGLEGKENNLPEELSGGEQQRVGIARALVNDPLLVIADEPTGNLDPKTSRQIIDLLLKINAKGTTVIMATHDRQMVDESRKRVVQISDGQVLRDDLEGGYDYEIYS